MTLLLRLPLFLALSGLVCLSMLVPAIYALVIEDFHDARSFFYSAVIGLVITSLVGLALANRRHNASALRQLLALVGAFVLLPLLMAVPFFEAVRNTTYLSAYFEMISAFTTTGATLFDPGRLSGPEHLWRAQVGWLGGLLMWIAASSILAPLTLGGFEITASGEPGQTQAQGAARGAQAAPRQRLQRATVALFPLYFGLTATLAIMLLVSGDPPLVAVSHAMAILSTSGISPVGSLEGLPSGYAGEVILFAFLFFALSRVTFSADTNQLARREPWMDPEFRMGVVIAIMVPLMLFIRHWVAAFDVGDERNLIAGLQAFWGGLFTALSFLTTTGFVSAAWGTAQSWSGLSTPGIILMGLALVGGGVATTAGGVKLLRIYTLYLNGAREIEKLIHPSSISNAGPLNRRMRREGAFIAWVFFMMFALTLAALSMLLGLLGVGFEPGLVLAIASLSNTGPLIEMASATPFDLIAAAPAVKLTLGGAMVFGRLELLAFIVMLSPDIWRS